LGAAAYTTITETDDIANSAENISGILGPFNFTSHFTTNWTGTSMTCDVSVYFDQSTGTTLGMANVTAKLYITYEYDDTSATQIKTVRIPFESSTAALPTANANFGTSQIPALTAGGILPENIVTIRDYFIVIEGNTHNNNNATDWTLNANIDADANTTYAFMTTEAALGSDTLNRFIYKPAVPDTTVSHNLQLWTAGAGRMNHVTVTLYITYEFTLSGTSRVLNSILIPIEIASPLGANTAANASRFFRTVFCVEPGVITLRQSSFRINWNTNSSVNISARAGAQAFRTYTSVSNGVCGMFSMQQRIDSGSAQGAGITFARGLNEITIDAYGSSTSVELTNVNGYLILNYESDLASSIGKHTTTLFRPMLDWNPALSDINRFSSSFPILPTNYRIIAAGFYFIQWVQSAGMAVTFDAQVLAGESKEAGYTDIYADAFIGDNERSCSVIWMRGRDTFKRCLQDMDTSRLNIETTRDYRLYTTTTCGNGIVGVVTLHTHTFTIAGNISGNDAGLPTTLYLINNVTNEVLQTQQLSAGTTSYSFTVYDDVIEYFVSAYQDNTRVGRSGLGTAT
jgi:hypothetical protein